MDQSQVCQPVGSSMNANAGPDGADGPAGPDDDGKAKLKRKCVDYHTPSVLHLSRRTFVPSNRPLLSKMDAPAIHPHSAYIRFMGLPVENAGSGSSTGISSTGYGAAPGPSEVYTTQVCHVTRAKNSSPVMCLSWTPGGRRLLTGNQDGEFTLWDGTHFTFELILSAHTSSFRSMVWSHNNNYLLTGDGGGNIKYWSPSIAPVESLDAHGGNPVHALSFAPSDTKFVSCGDDSTVRVWDFERRTEERVLEGHGWDVKTVAWHPRSSVIASGSKDNLAKLWDPRTGDCLCTLYGHKNTVTKVAWNDNGNWLLTASRDQMIKLYDIRAMRELATLKGHNKEVTSLAWHPLHESCFASGGMDGTLLFWEVGPKGSEEPAARVPFAHDMAIWDMKWHPAGHLLATGSNDRQTKFWARSRPGSSGGADRDPDDDEEGERECLTDEMELGNHVGIVIGRRGATIISMQRATGTKMHVDQVRRVLEIEGTRRQIETVKRRVGALLDRVSNDSEQRQRDAMGGGPGGFGH
mmetsp:Transcript_43108/g.84704  ORF Transcript_43108/g.84704 Transcript_43108/m.84704 type:complete len:522 (+) Transcript_43108:71-1636(+)